MLKTFIGAALATIALTAAAGAATLQITATSASRGELGYFIVDEDVLETDRSLVASQYEDFRFVSPLSGQVYDPTTVLSDTGVTVFTQVAGEWTVTGGGGDSLTSASGNVWVAGDNYVGMDNFTVSLYDVTWSTTEYAVTVVPLPAGGGLLLASLGIFGAVARRRKRA